MRIKFAADILRRLGEELNPSLDKGILELVKNSYDADAINCTIDLLGTDHAGGAILVSDDGQGMTAKEIESGWLVLGRSIKSSQEQTKLGRTPAGSKGLGRLAALRMGSRALLTTRPEKLRNKELNLLIDWDSYRNVELIDEVELELEESICHDKTKPGTDIRIENLAMRIGRREVRRLARELILLAGPFGEDETGFKPILKAPEFRDLEKLVQNKYFQEAEYHLIASVSKDGIASARVEDWRNAVLYSGSHADISNKKNKGNYQCPEVDFDFWIFLLAQKNFEMRSASLGEVRAWLQEFGGVHIYQNGLRVAPYGDHGNDWLDLNLSRARSPEERPSTNTSIGRVLIRDPDAVLSQKTDRSGFIETDTFSEIHSFCTDVLNWLATRRLETAERYRQTKRIEAPRLRDESKKQLDAAVNKLPEKARDHVRKAVDQAWGAVNKEITEYQKEIQLYRTLSTAGITAATFAHESSGNPIKAIEQAINAIERRSRKLLANKYESDLKAPIDVILQAIAGLSVLGDATLKLLNHEKRRIGRVDIHQVLRDVLFTFGPFLESRQIAVETILFDGTPYLRGSEAAVESVITNLLNNSVTAFESASIASRRVVFQTTITNINIEIRVNDNGPGINGIEVRDIWLPGRTTKLNGTGLGLTIVRDTVSDLGGQVNVNSHGDLGGAEFIISLPIMGA